MVSESNVQRICHWLGQCEISHYTCGSSFAWLQKHSAAPTRLLDVRSQKETWVRLVETHGHAGQYVALSYCWGENPPKLCTTRGTYRRMLAGVPCRLLSKTVQDAVLVVQKLGIRYLWVDALCIKQDDREDWDIEAQNMGLIYANACLTIAATSANGADKGFLSARSENEVTTRFRASQGAAIRGTVYWQSYADFFDDYFEYVINGPLLRRGWVTQERLLSRRTVDFSRKRLYFQCRFSACCEDGDIDGDRQTGYEFVDSVHLLSMLQESKGYVPKEMWVSFFKTWATIISDYSQLELTRQNDRLDAVAGIANIGKLSIPGRYLSGIWEINFADGLLWHPLKPPMERAGIRYAPSWSWASSTQGVKFGGHFPDESCLGLVKVSKGADDLERLHVRGRAHRCYVSLEPESPRPCRSDRKFVDQPLCSTTYAFTTMKNTYLSADATISDNSCVFDGTRGHDAEFTFLRTSCSPIMKIKHCRGLLLRRVGPAEGKFYERVGFGWSSDSTWHTAKESEICLV